MRRFILLFALCGCNPPATTPTGGTDDPVEDKAGDNAVFDVPKTDDTVALLPLVQLQGDWVIEASDPQLLGNLQEQAFLAAEASIPVDAKLRLAPGTSSGGLTLQLDAEREDVSTLLTAGGAEIAPAGNYTVIGLHLLRPTQPSCSVSLFDEVLPDLIRDESGETEFTGCCAVLATAHSLVRKMGRIVPEDEATTTNDDGDKVWDPDFLNDVLDAAGGDAEDRSLTDGQAEDAHTADWNDSWDIDQVRDDEELYDGDNEDCDTIRTRCQTLIGQLETNDDISMRIRAFDPPDDDDWGHRVPVESATFNEDNCCCTIEITRTSRQEPSGRPDLTNISFDPGTAQYEICQVGEVTTVTNTEFPASTITDLSWDQFDEAPANDQVEGTTQGSAGEARTRSAP